MKYKISFLVLVGLFCALIIPSKSLATSWAYPFVVWDGYIYIVEEEYVTEIDKEIGKVTRYSDMYPQSGNFSNVYERGTKYYAIKDVSTDEAIAVEDGSGKYKKAVREKEYTYGNEDSPADKSSDMTATLLILSAITIFLIIFILKKLKR
ncbi:hypothetical protein [Fictibacillus halophilus]|uniref:hypothetical protein n=1 Tax=Fictibacillus halophilus TaxID=1610490 RepID=UPI001CFB914E|nr:hypothetical protein [Fictibacillus halophilus]